MMDLARTKKGDEMSIGSLKFVASLLSAGLLMSSFSYTSAGSTSVPNFAIQQTDQGDVALREGRRLLKRGRSDQALIQLRNALNLYTNSKNQSGVAATHNELGDLYLRQGQYTVALDHYQKALDGFLGVDKKNEAVNAVVGIADDKFNANLMLAKIGDVNFRLGRTSEAMSAYSRMVVKKPESAGSKVTRRFGGLGASQIAIRKCRHLQVNVDAIEQRSRDATAIALHCVRQASARVRRIAGETAWARVHGSGEHDARGIAQRDRGAAQGDESILQRLPQRLEHVAAEFRDLIEE